MEKIKLIFMGSRKTYGTRGIKRVLAKEGVTISRRRIGRIMAKQDLVCKATRKFKVTTTDSNHDLSISPDLLDSDFSPENADLCYAGDITYIPTRESWLYLSVVLDLFSRRVVGWAMDSSMKAELVNHALSMALWTRKPARGLISHTDRGSQYASDSHRLLLKEYGVIQSMSRRGDCWDNAVSESFFHSLKVELVHHRSFKTRKEAKQAIFEYIEIFYNRVRLHSTNDYLSPADFKDARVFD